MSDDWPDPVELCNGLLDALAKGHPSAIDWAGELLVAIDRVLGTQVAVIISQPPFSALHASWAALKRVTDAAAEAGAPHPVEVQALDATAADLVDDASHALRQLIYANPIDTRGGTPFTFAVTGLDVPPLIAVLAEQAICPIFCPESTVRTGRFLLPASGHTLVRSSGATDHRWTGWFDWPSVETVPLSCSRAYAGAAEAIRSILWHGWPNGVDDDAQARMLISARLCQIVTVHARAMAHRPPTEIAYELSDLLRGQYVGPRLPLRKVDVTVVAADGRLAFTLNMSPRIAGDDPGGVPLTIGVELAAG